MEYIRKVVYFQEYKDGKRQFTRPGFARLERRNGIWNLAVIPEETGLKGKVSLYIVGESPDGCAAYSVGELELQKTVNMSLSVDFGWFIRELKQICGILIGTQEHYLAGKCQGVSLEVSFETVEVWKPYALAAEEKPEEEAEISGALSAREEKEMEDKEEEVKEAEAQEAEELKKEGTEEQTEEELKREGRKEQAMDAGRKNPFAGLQSMYPFEDDEMEWCYQIEPKDLGNFSAKQWHMASNSFLLQGYYNYRHLLFAHKKGKNYIGVPGQFHRREQYLASRFGFAQFKGTQKKRVTMGDFGYWMCELD